MGALSSVVQAGALRLVPTKDLSRAEWLAVRQQGIGSSDAAAAVGLHPFKSPLALWLEKTGRQPVAPAPTEGPLYWGQALEPLVAKYYSQQTGRRVRRVNAVLQHPDPQLPWMLANLDREVLGCPEVQVLECKTVGLQGARLWRDGVPEYVQLQVLHQLAVTGKAAADVAVLLGGHQWEIHRIERDEELIQRLIALEQDFWQWVERDEPPPADGSASAEAALRVLYPQDDGRVLDFREDQGLSQTFRSFKQVRQQIGALEQQEAEYKQCLQQAMGEASEALFVEGRVSWKRSQASTTLDSARLLKEHPELAQQSPLTREGSRRFIVR